MMSPEITAVTVCFGAILIFSAVMSPTGFPGIELPLPEVERFISYPALNGNTEVPSLSVTFMSVIISVKVMFSTVSTSLSLYR